MAKYEMDMTRGPLLTKIIRFSIPLILTGILQILYNTADSVVVGQFAGKESLAAVGSTGTLTNLIVNLFIGLSIGTSVVVSNLYGARDILGIRTAVHTSIVISGAAGMILSVLGITLARPLLTLLNTPPDIIDGAVLYMRLYFVGMPFNMVYNFGASILRAVGDTKRPLYFLMLAGFVNVVLNVLFVVVFRMDVAGVALATVIAQILSAFLVIRCLLRADNEIRLDPKSFRIDRRVLFRIARIGLPAGLQNVLFDLANILIQASVNSFGSDAVAANSAAGGLEAFIWVSMNAVAQAAVTFSGQNLGAKQYKRMRRVLPLCILYVAVLGGIMCNLFWVFRMPLLSIYNADPAVLQVGALRLAYLPLYFLCGVMDTTSGYMRGMGYSTLPAVITLTGSCLLRIIWLYTVFAAFHTMDTLFLVYPVSWFITAAAQYGCSLILQRKFPKEDTLLQSIAA